MDPIKELLKRYFIPHKGNEYNPHFLQKASAAGILLLIVLTFATANVQSLMLLSSSWLTSSILPAVIVDLTNEDRADASLGALKRNALLDEAAQLKAEDMAKYEYFAHTSPAGVTPWYWFERAGYDYAYAGENLAVHFNDSDAVVKAWMNSPGHRANILGANYTEIGIGTAKGSYKGSPTVFVVQLFGRPLTAAEKAEIAAATPQKVAPASVPVTPVVVTQPRAIPPTNTLGASSTEVAEAPVATSSSESSTTIPAKTDDIADEEAGTPLTAAGNATLVPPSDYELPEVATSSPYIAIGAVAPSGGNSEQTERSEVRLSDTLTRASARPHMFISIMYAILASLIFLALILSIVIEWRRQNPVQAMYGAGLLVAIWVALFIQTHLAAGVLII